MHVLLIHIRVFISVFEHDVDRINSQRTTCFPDPPLQQPENQSHHNSKLLDDVLLWWFTDCWYESLIEA